MEIILLILKIIQIILTGKSSTEAVKRISDDSGVSFEELWSNLSSKYK